MITVPRIFNRVFNGVWAKMREEGGLKLKLFEAALAAAKQKRETGKVTFKYKILDKIVLQKIRARFGGRLENAVTGSAPMNVESPNSSLMSASRLMMPMVLVKLPRPLRLTRL